MFKAVHGITPHYISNMIICTFEVNERDLRSGDVMTLCKPIPHIDLYKSTLANNGPHVWNNLSFNLRSVLSLDILNRSYKMNACHKNVISVIKECVLSAAVCLHGICIFILMAFNTHLVHCFIAVL